MINRNIINSIGDNFLISLSVGTMCDSICPYCDVNKLPQKIADGFDLINAIEWFINSLRGKFNNFYIRITGGEIGFVPNLIRFFDYINLNSMIKEVDIFTKGDLFNVCNNESLTKCNVYDHLIHNILKDKFIRYDSIPPPSSLFNLISIIEKRKEKCRKYLCVMVDDINIDNNLRKNLVAKGIHFYPRINRICDKVFTIDISKINENEYLKCFHSKKYYVFDVAYGVFFNCCEVKDPSLGVTYDTLEEFFFCSDQSPYEQCKKCNRPNIDN